MKELFGVEKPIIALLHIGALPGDPGYDYEKGMDHVLNNARKDLAALQGGGVDGILFSNEYSQPYQRKVDCVTPCAMARVISELRREMAVPFGVHVISDPSATIELAAAVDARFVRSIFSGVYAGEMGIRDNDIAKLIRRKNELRLYDLKMFYMINSESDGDLSNRSLADIAQAIIVKCKPDGLCVSGKSAGNEADSELIASVRMVARTTPVLCNTGVRCDNVTEKLSVSDGAFIGTTFKYDGIFENAVDESRVRCFMDRVKAYREDRV
jgi:membrane complex biogenesis BtpA family protein